MKKFLLILSVFFFIANNSIGQSEKKYGKTLKEMFEVSGSMESYNTVIKQMIELYKQQYANVDPEIWDELEDEFLKTSLNDLVNMLVPVYQKYLTQDDLQEVIKFYNSPVGKKYAEKTPLIIEDSMQVGQEWGIKLGEDFIKKMEEKGY